MARFLPVGGDRPVQSDFRLISATHQDLRQRVAEGRFRHDLYFRLITFEIEIPPLRQRREDIAELAAHFLTGLAAKNEQSRPAISAEALAELQRRPWLGNVRELRNAIEHAMILARGGIIAPEHLPPPLAPPEMGSGPISRDGSSPAVGWGSPSHPVDPTAFLRVPDAMREEAIVSLVRQWAELQLQDPAAAEDLYDRLLRFMERPLLQAAMEHCGGQCLPAAAGSACTARPCAKNSTSWESVIREGARGQTFTRQRSS